MNLQNCFAVFKVWFVYCYSTIKTALGDIVKAVKLGTDRTALGAEEVKKVQEFVRNLSSGMDDTLKQAERIAVSVSEQSTGFSGVLGATNMINRMAEENIETVDKMEQTVRSVDRAVDNLTALVERE